MNDSVPDIARLAQAPVPIHTERLMLRCPRPGDGMVLHAAINDSMEELKPWAFSLAVIVQDRDPLEWESFCTKLRASFIDRSYFCFLVFERQCGDFVGWVSLQDVDWSVPKCELGFWCCARQLGQGYMKEALSAALDYAVISLEFRRIACLVDEKNFASRSLCQRLGFSYEGVLRNERKGPGESLRNTFLYALVN